MPYPLVEREWRRLLGRLRQQGVQRTCADVVQLIEGGPYPLALTIRLVEFLLERRHYGAAGAIIKAVDESGAAHPLFDKLHSSWLWSIGEQRAAVAFALKSAKHWHKSYLAHHVGTLYRCMADRQKSDYYRKKSDYYWGHAHSLAQQEEADKAKKGGNRR